MVDYLTIAAVLKTPRVTWNYTRSTTLFIRAGVQDKRIAPLKELLLPKVLDTLLDLSSPLNPLLPQTPPPLGLILRKRSCPMLLHPLRESTSTIRTRLAKAASNTR
ncbi:unnamed protein product [Amoebophrya sp. A25]|nr:unnamed protein product [Amoebophrya sp. A25]|eukprot:GSA25T00003761001.1